MPVLAPVIGGILQTWISWHASFVLLLLCGVIMLGLMIGVFKETKTCLQKKPLLKDLLKNYISFFRNKIFVIHLIIITLFYTGEVAYIIQLPLIAQKVFLVTPFYTGWLVVFTSSSIIIGGLLSSVLLKKYEPSQLIKLGVHLAALAILTWFYFIFNHQYMLLTFTLPMSLFMLGSGLAFPNAVSKCLDCFPEQTGAASSLALGGLTTLGGLLTLIVAKLPIEVDYALPGFLAIIVLLMIMTEYLGQK